MHSFKAEENRQKPAILLERNGGVENNLSSKFRDPSTNIGTVLILSKTAKSGERANNYGFKRKILSITCSYTFYFCMGVTYAVRFSSAPLKVL